MWDNMGLFIGIVLITPTLIAAGAGIVFVFFIIALHSVTQTVDSESP